MIQPRIFGRVNLPEIVGRDAELREIVRHASAIDESRGLVVGAAPDAGASELLRQAYDRLFANRGSAAPLLLRFNRTDAEANETARRLVQNFLQQYIAYRRVDPSLCEARMTLSDLLELAPPGDYELIAAAIEAFERESSSNNLPALLLSLPHRFAAAGRNIFPLIDCMSLLSPLDVTLARELVSAVKAAGVRFVLAGRRRQLNDLLHAFENEDRGNDSILHLDELSDRNAQQLVELLSHRHRLETNEATRDLIVRQLHSSPKLITGLFEAAREAQGKLDSFLAFERIYVDELMGGRIKRSFDNALESISVDSQRRRTLLRLLYESAKGETHKTSLWSWKKRLGLAASEFERVVDALHVSEFINSSGAFIEVNIRWQAWIDYLTVQYRLEVAGEPRAQVVATTLVETLKRAPDIMARNYRSAAALKLDELVMRFDCQKVPATLFHYDKFAALYRGEESELIESGLKAEAEPIELPQIVQSASCSAFSVNIACESERCIVAHGFDGGEYSDENETVWLCAQVDSKLEAGRELTETWCNRLVAFARESGFARFQIWLIAPEGFSASASELLDQHGAFGSSHQQIEFLKSQLELERRTDQTADEFEMVIPMSSDTELIAARTAEQIARRVKFQPAAINQIKTAVVEACINAAEHSLSPDRKIYQRFVVEDDKLIITVASRGVLPTQPGTNSDPNDQGNGNGRRGWGLKLIKTLMDEVVFERVDDGTQLRMTKYRK